MKSKTKDVAVFFQLLRLGLFPEREVQAYDIQEFNYVDWAEVYRLAEEQSVVGLIAAGIENVQDAQKFNGSRVPQEWALQFIGTTLQIEQQNTAMNLYLANLVERMRGTGIYTLLVKGQGVAQCYEKPQWRSCGDIDFFLSEDNYEKTKNYLLPLATSHEQEAEYDKHLGMNIDGWVVELHGNLRSGLSSRIDRELDDIYRDTFYSGNVHSWQIGKTQIFMLGIENDVIYVFTHFLKHFFKEGLGVRQICDWCRLLWTYREKLDLKKLEPRIGKMGLMSEWKAFGAYAVKYLGMPVEAMPFYSFDTKWRNKANQINDFILKVGNMGHNRDMSYFSKKPYLVRKCISMGRRVGNLLNHARIFPLDSMRFMVKIMSVGLKSVAKGE